jgi:hypothetical protein
MKKSQAAMEFLMTYGWAILVVITAISALAYFGVLDFKAMMPKHCTMSPGMICKDFEIYYNNWFSTSDFQIVIVNGLGTGIYITDIELDSERPYTAKTKIFTQGETNLQIFCENFNHDRKDNDPASLDYLTSDGEKIKCKLFDFRKNNHAIRDGQEDKVEFIIKYVNQDTNLEHSMTATASR